MDHELVQGQELEAEWNYALILLSYALSVFGSWTSFMMVEQGKLALKKGTNPTACIVWAGVALGGCGIFGMHFIGMTALTVGVQLQYEPRLVVVSVIAPIGFIVAAFLVSMRGYELRQKSVYDSAAETALAGAVATEVSDYAGLHRTPMQKLREITPQMAKEFMQTEVFNRHLLSAALLSGTGVAIMQYTGMAALQFRGSIEYNAGVVFASILIAIVASAAALVLLFNLQSPSLQIISALVMGVAVCGAHYTGMQVVFRFDNTVVEPDELISKNDIGLVVAFVSIITCFFLEVFGAARIKNAKLKLDKIVDETRAELFQTIDEMIRLRRSLEFQKDMNLLIKAVRPALEGSEGIDEFITVLVALTGRTYNAEETKKFPGDRYEMCRQILSHPVGFELFKDQMIRNHKAENILFFAAVELYQGLGSNDRKTQATLAKQITKRFIENDSDCEINISNIMRNRIQERLTRKPASDIFSEAQEEVFRLMVDNDFSSFSQTREGHLALWLARNMKESEPIDDEFDLKQLPAGTTAIENDTTVVIDLQK